MILQYICIKCGIQGETSSPAENIVMNVLGTVLGTFGL